MKLDPGDAVTLTIKNQETADTVNRLLELFPDVGTAFGKAVSLMHNVIECEGQPVVYNPRSGAPIKEVSFGIEECPCGGPPGHVPFGVNCRR